MTTGVASTGTELALSATGPLTQDEAGYSALTWVPWDDVTNIGDIGPDANVQNYIPVKSGVVFKIPTSVDNGTVDAEAPFDDSNPAQAIVAAAAAQRPIASVWCRITYSTGSIDYFRALPSSFKKKVGGAQAILMLGGTLQIAGDLTEVAAP